MYPAQYCVDQLLISSDVQHEHILPRLEQILLISSEKDCEFASCLCSAHVIKKVHQETFLEVKLLLTLNYDIKKMFFFHLSC